jgi:hypothetical protein
VVRRLAAPLSHADDAVEMVRLFRATVAHLDPRAHTVLVDLRAAPLRDETVYRDAMRALRRAVVVGFRRTAFLVQTSVGQLQVTRYLAEEGLAGAVFLDEASALRHLA